MKKQPYRSRFLIALSIGFLFEKQSVDSRNQGTIRKVTKIRIIPRTAMYSVSALVYQLIY